MFSYILHVNIKWQLPPTLLLHSCSQQHCRGKFTAHLVETLASPKVVNMKDSRATFRMDMPFYIGVV